MFPWAWSQGVGDFASDMETVSAPDQIVLVNRMISFMERLSWSPYPQLERLKKHRFGTLRLWPKWEVLQPIWERHYARVGSSGILPDPTLAAGTGSAVVWDDLKWSLW